MSDTYDGPAVLLDADGNEVPVRAHLGIQCEPVLMNFGGPFYEEAPGTLSWGGFIETDGPFAGRFEIPGTLRTPDGREGKIISMAGDGGSPVVEIEGRGEAPWDWQL